MSDEQVKAFVEWVDETHPTSRKIAGAWLRKILAQFALPMHTA
jgi:hypothetical protein